MSCIAFSLCSANLQKKKEVKKKERNSPSDWATKVRYLRKKATNICLADVRILHNTSEPEVHRPPVHKAPERCLQPSLLQLQVCPGPLQLLHVPCDLLGDHSSEFFQSISSPVP